MTNFHQLYYPVVMVFYEELPLTNFSLTNFINHQCILKLAKYSFLQIIGYCLFKLLKHLNYIIQEFLSQWFQLSFYFGFLESSSLFSLYLKKQELVFVNQSVFDEFNTIKTKNIVNLIKDLGVKETERILFILPLSNNSLWLASRNLKNIEITTANSLNIEQILKTKYIILSNSSLEII